MKYPRLHSLFWNVALFVTSVTLYTMAYYSGVARGRVEGDFNRAITTCRAEVDNLLRKYPEQMEDKR